MYDLDAPIPPTSPISPVHMLSMASRSYARATRHIEGNTGARRQACVIEAQRIEVELMRMWGIGVTVTGRTVTAAYHGWYATTNIDTRETAQGAPEVTA